MPRILLIDDEELVIRSLEKLLKKEGFEVEPARNGLEAIKKAGEVDFDLVVTDIRMPELNGIDTLEQIREVLQRKGSKAVPEICITGYADEELQERAERLGVADYLYKPFDIRDFLACINKHLKSTKIGSSF